MPRGFILLKDYDALLCWQILSKALLGYAVRTIFRDLDDSCI